MNKRPNSFQKLLHRFAMLKPVSLFLANSLHYLDSATFKLTKGKYGFAEIVGLPMVEVTTIGAKSGQPRAMPLAAYKDGEKFVLIGSNFGRKPNPGWYYNLSANPNCTVHVNGQTHEYVARELSGEEREKYWQLAVSYYAGYEKYKQRASHRRIPVMLLERVK
ncbi:MAG: nitroreductase family deazaflavin-dependent oxidoreductase [Anaerolineales bacterium]|nr:nitroreductase family deazaflavin-dependent oxidoreductase [Anaerolineales bacterium]